MTVSSINVMIELFFLEDHGTTIGRTSYMIFKIYPHCLGLMERLWKHLLNLLKNKYARTKEHGVPEDKITEFCGSVVIDDNTLCFDQE